MNDTRRQLRTSTGAFAIYDLMGRSYEKLESKLMRIGYHNPNETLELNAYDSRS